MNLLSDVRDSHGAGERPNDRNIAKSGIPARSLSDRNGEPAATIVLELEKMLASRRENSGTARVRKKEADKRRKKKNEKSTLPSACGLYALCACCLRREKPG